jgi:hypothetical protein
MHYMEVKENNKYGLGVLGISLHHDSLLDVGNYKSRVVKDICKEKKMALLQIDEP